MRTIDNGISQTSRRMSHIEIRPVSVGEARPLRDAVLRPNLPEGGSVYPGDDCVDTLHLGAFAEDGLISVATICREPRPGTDESHSWRLRGMGTREDWRGRGWGKRLALTCLAHAALHAGRVVWCSARVSTVDFYRSLGFSEEGGEFRLPQYSASTYVIMSRKLPCQNE